MDPKDAFRWINEATKAAYSRPSRFKALTEAVSDLRPDALEALDLVDAIAAGLKLRYENPTEVLLLMSLLKEALDRLDVNCQVDADDILNAYERMTDRRKS